MAEQYNLSENSNVICRVGYALNEKKMRKSGKSMIHESETCYSSRKDWHGGGLADILTDNVENGVLFQPFDFGSKDQPFFHVIIHKLTEDIERDDSRDKIKSLEMYLQRNPKTVIIDPISSIKRVISRGRTCVLLQELCRDLGGSPFSQPAFIVSDHPSNVPALMRAANMRFPVICKPLEACGTPNSHSMVVLVNETGLPLLRCPCVVQQYRDHGGVFYKVYVIGDDVMVFRRPSLPDLASVINESPDLVKCVSFDSRYVYPSLSDFFADKLDSTLEAVAGPTAEVSSGLQTKKLNTPESTDDLPIPIERFHATARLLRHGMGLSLFGFDVIVPTGEPTPCASSADGRDLVVIDVNFFPSYKEVVDFPTRLREFLRQRGGLSRWNC